MEEKMSTCPHCGGNACYEQVISEEVTTSFCFGCGYSTSTLMTDKSELVIKTLETSPELYKDLMFIDSNSLVWFPSTVTLPEKGMVFLDGNSKENWKWAAVNSIKILEEEKAKFPKDQTTKMDMKNIKHFEKEDFMEALDAINFFDVEVAESE
jgi:hypothetical protein